MPKGFNRGGDNGQSRVISGNGMDDYDDVDDSAEDGNEEIVDAIHSVKEAVEESSLPKLFVVLAVAFGILYLFDSVWHSKVRYSLQYDVPYSKITIEKEPHDCNFLAAPLGEKYCHYERVIETVHWARSKPTVNQSFPLTTEGRGQRLYLMRVNSSHGIRRRNR